MNSNTFDNSTFVRKSFYLQPPTNNASVEEWQNWLNQDNQAAKTAKAQFTRSRKAKDIAALPELSVVKVGGVYRQVVALGLVGNDENCHAEPIVEATQEISIDVARRNLSAHNRGGNKKNKRAAQKAKRRQARNARFIKGK